MRERKLYHQTSTLCLPLLLLLSASASAAKMGQTCLGNGNCDVGLHCETCVANGGIRPRCTRIRPSDRKCMGTSLPFNRYAWLTTHNSFARLGQKSRTGTPIITATNQQDSIADQLNKAMASKHLGDFDAVNLTSSVPASAAICSSSSNSCGGGRAIDRHSPHLKDPLREKYFNPLLSRFYSKAKSNKQKIRKNAEKCPQSISPASSSRFLLNDSPVFDDFNDTEANPSVTPTESSKFESSKGEDLTQVVVLRVSLHCKGCERKVRKHIAKMKGVTSFSTDLAAKKVTVVGDVTPLSVLNSVSKVKNAQFWPSHS